MTGSGCVQVFTHISNQTNKEKDFKSQRFPCSPGCPPNYQVQKGSHPLCSPQPTLPGGLAPFLQQEAWFSQSRSSKLWPVLCCRERIARSCR